MKTSPLEGALQNGMLAYYLSKVKFSDANVEARLAQEPFDFRGIPAAKEALAPEMVAITPNWRRGLANL